VFPFEDARDSGSGTRRVVTIGTALYLPEVPALAIEKIGELSIKFTRFGAERFMQVFIFHLS
jgi:hypothetical protein